MLRSNTKPAVTSSCLIRKASLTPNPRRNYASATDLVQPQSLILPRLVQLLTASQSLKLTRKSHARALVLGLHQNSFLATKIISSYADANKLADSRRVFNTASFKTVFLWNTLISAYAKRSDYRPAFELFREMCRGDESPDGYTAAILVKATGEISDVAVAGEMVHGRSLRSGFVSDVVVSNSLVFMYSKRGDLAGARKVFDEMPQRSSASWNNLIAGLARRGDREEDVWELVRRMRIDGVDLDGFTISILLPLCSGDRRGREIHCYAVRNRSDVGVPGYDARLGCCLVDMYSKSKRLAEARRVFDHTINRNVFVWTAIVNGHAENGDPDRALSLFRQMESPNRVSLLAALKSCDSRGGLIGCKQVHGYAVRNRLDDDASLFNALIDAYAKCGALEFARRVFDEGNFRRDVISFSTMIGGYGSHGGGAEAVSLYREMVRGGSRPDAITLVGVLSACARSGLVDEGLEIYASAVNQHSIEPTAEICGCVVDLLGRAGRLDRALEFIESMRMRVRLGPSAWGSLLNAAVIHGDESVRQVAYEALAALEPRSAANLVSLSNSYATSERWVHVAGVREAMREKGMRKEPGCSWISVNSVTHCFYVADEAHPCSDELYRVLHNLVLVMREQESFCFY